VERTVVYANSRFYAASEFRLERSQRHMFRTSQEANEMNQPGFTAEAALYKAGMHQLMAVWAVGTDGRITPAQFWTCGPCHRDPDNEGVCEKTCCRTGRIDGERVCRSEWCECPPSPPRCGGCQPNPTSPTGFSQTCCRASGACFTRPCAPPPPPVECTVDDNRKCFFPFPPFFLPIPVPPSFPGAICVGSCTRTCCQIVGGQNLCGASPC